VSVSENSSSTPLPAPTLAQQRVLVAVKAALGAAYRVEWIARAGSDQTPLLVQHVRSRRAAALLFDDPETCGRLKVEDYLGVIASADKRAAEIAAVAATRPEEARALIREGGEAGATTGLNYALDAALMALAAERFGQE
jgi:hypothetical protein